MFDLEYYSSLSKIEDKLILIAVYKDAITHAVVEKAPFEAITDIQLCICQELLKSLEGSKKA